MLVEIVLELTQKIVVCQNTSEATQKTAVYQVVSEGVNSKYFHLVILRSQITMMQLK